MIKIIPAILPNFYGDIERGVQKIQGSASTVQIDFVDGFYAPNRTWFFNHKSEDVLPKLLREDMGLPDWETMNYDFDLIIKEPLKQIETFLALGPSRIIFHLGSVSVEELKNYFENVPEVVSSLVKFAIALRTTDDPKDIAPLIPFINMIQVMGIKEIGVQGKPFDDAVYDYVAAVHALYPAVPIAVDGGINFENAPKLVQAGATRLVVGSTIFKSTLPSSTIEELKRICAHAAKNTAAE